MRYKIKSGSIKDIQFDKVERPEATVVDCKALAKTIKRRAKAQMTPDKQYGLIIYGGDSPDGTAYRGGIIKDCKEMGIHTVCVGGDCEEIPVVPYRDTPFIALESEKTPPIKSLYDLDDEEGPFGSCTVDAVMEIAKAVLPMKSWDLGGKTVVIVGRGAAGHPMAQRLLDTKTTVISCNSKTPDLKSLTRQADILIAATDKAHLITADMVKPGAIVIDVGTVFVDGKLCGNVDFENVKKKCAFITPVPGGVGLVTRAILIKHIVDFYKVEW